MDPITRGIDYGTLVHRDRVDSRIFTDQSIFETEMVKIFEGGWVYIAHESEIPEPGDYVTRLIGRQPVILMRTDTEVKLHLNRCVHRGTALCTIESGNAKFLRCPYHGWTYRSDGRLVGVPYSAGYGADFDKADFGLASASHVSEYRGFFFGSLTPTTMTLEQWLGPRVLAVIDSFLNASPVQRIIVRSGSHKTAFRGNWKYVGMDGYHVNFTHKSLMALAEHHGESVGGEDFGEKSSGLAWDFGHGHCRLDRKYPQGQLDELLAGVRKAPGGEQYVAALEAEWGDKTGEVIALSRDPHLGVWPNLQLIGYHIRVIRPIAPDRTEVILYPTQLEAAPDFINDERLRTHEWFFGSAGFVQPDDSELFERNQVGLHARANPWIYLGRGLERETMSEDGSIAGHITDETTQRGQMKMWLNQMSGPASFDEALR